VSGEGAPPPFRFRPAAEQGLGRLLGLGSRAMRFHGREGFGRAAERDFDRAYEPPTRA